MTITFSIVDVIRILFLLMLFSVATVAYIQGWRIFCNGKLDNCDRVFGGGILWAISLGCVGVIWAIVGDIPIL